MTGRLGAAPAGGLLLVPQGRGCGKLCPAVTSTSHWGQDDDGDWDRGWGVGEQPVPSYEGSDRITPIPVKLGPPSRSAATLSDEVGSRTSG